MDKVRSVVNRYFTVSVDPPERKTPEKGAKVLIVHAHPSAAHSFSSEILKTSVESLLSQGNEVKIVNPADGSFNPLLTEIEHRNRYNSDFPHSANLKQHFETLKWADKILFIYPTWWNGTPAGLKGYIDRVFAANVAYKPPEDEIFNGKETRFSKLLKRRPSIEPLLETQKIGVITTYGGPFWQTLYGGDLGRRLLCRIIPMGCCKSSPEILFMKLHNVYESNDRRISFLNKVSEKMKSF
jgi:NAD(P)H dehydrogenase (quinone)